MDNDLLKSFQCTQCGECCRWPGSVLLTDRDITVLAERLERTEEQFIGRYTRLAPNRIQLALTEQPDGSCVFLEQNRCAVYDGRPLQCRSFPFTWRVSRGCPALDRLPAGQKNVDQEDRKS